MNAFHCYVEVILAHRSTGLVEMLELTERFEHGVSKGKPKYLGTEKTPSGRVSKEMLATYEKPQYKEYQEIKGLLLRMKASDTPMAADLPREEWEKLELTMTPVEDLEAMMVGTVYEFVYRTQAAMQSKSNDSNLFKTVARDVWILANLPSNLEAELFESWPVHRLHDDLHSLPSSTWFVLNEEPDTNEEGSPADQVRNQALVMDREVRAMSANVAMKCQADSAFKSPMCIKVFREGRVVVVLTESGMSSLKAVQEVSLLKCNARRCVSQHCRFQSLIEGLINGIRADVATDDKPVDFFQAIDAHLEQGIRDGFMVPPLMEVPHATRVELAAYFSRDSIAARRLAADDEGARILEEHTRQDLEESAKKRKKGDNMWPHVARKQAKRLKQMEASSSSKMKRSKAAETKAIQDVEEETGAGEWQCLYACRSGLNC